MTTTYMVQVRPSREHLWYDWRPLPSAEVEGWNQAYERTRAKRLDMPMYATDEFRLVRETEEVIR